MHVQDQLVDGVIAEVRAGTPLPIACSIGIDNLMRMIVAVVDLVTLPPSLLFEKLLFAFVILNQTTDGLLSNHEKIFQKKGRKSKF